jgi:uncharacterized protein with FMN-binding domain
MKQGLGMLVVIILIALVVFLIVRPAQREIAYDYEDGTYRGVFIDKDAIQVNVQFTLEDNIVTAAGFRYLRRDDNYHLEAEQEPYKSVIQQYKEALEHLIGKDINVHLRDLYSPEDIVRTEVAGYTSATIRSSKIISAIRDGLNRGVYGY